MAGTVQNESREIYGIEHCAGKVATLRIWLSFNDFLEILFSLLAS